MTDGGASGGGASRNVVDLEAPETLAYLRGEELELDAGDPRCAAGYHGYVIVRYAGLALGCGIWRQTRIESALARSRRVAAIDLPPRGTS